MGGKQKWTIADEVLKELFKKNAIERLNDIADSYEPEQDDINSSIELAGEWVKIYAEQIKLGLSKLWVCTYADYRVSWPKDDSANEAYNNVCKNFGEEKADKDLAIFTKSLCDDPVFVKSYIDFFHDGFMDAENRAHEYTNLYKSLIEKGKSPIYAEKYTICYLDDYLPVSCDLYASKYEECITKGIDGNKAMTIAEEYENYCNPHFPQNEADNGIDSPEEFAKEYQRAYYNNGKRPSYVAKGKYDDIISQLLADKVSF